MLDEILREIVKNGGTPYIVGGTVRDLYMGIMPKDTDVEVFWMSAEVLLSILARYGDVAIEGESFGVIKLRTPDKQDYDFSLPRRESKIGSGHKGFMIEVDPTMTLVEASARRDYTINAMSVNMAGDLIDPYGGTMDIKYRILRHTSPAFSEDPLRVLRGMQFAGRFDMTLDVETACLCFLLINEYKTLAKERIWGEWYKWAAKSIKPSAGLKLLSECGWDELYPEINAMKWCPQDAEYHPEGNCLIHTMYTCDAAAEIAIREGLSEEARATLVFAALCHDMGKPITTVSEGGRIRSPGHDEAGVPLAISFMQSINAPKDMTAEVAELTHFHMRHTSGDISPRMARRLRASMKCTSVAMLMFVMEADHSGRPPLPKGLPEAARHLGELMDIEVANNTVAPWALGRHLIAAGFKPGPMFGVVLQKIHDQQLDGLFASPEEAVLAAVLMASVTTQ